MVISAIPFRHCVMTSIMAKLQLDSFAIQFQASLVLPEKTLLCTKTKRKGANFEREEKNEKK